MGGGTAGNVVANRLTENANFSVLVLEASSLSDVGVLPDIVPFLVTIVASGTPYDWNYSTTAQSGLNGRSLSYPRCVYGAARGLRPLREHHGR
ncbi:hypothetical protein DFH07DRAFT_931148 [Mycena maculata]|uniref:Glucose-methanol-choline oxidoreductase N-terminal domain-containing protein n=1 Tax=Mycena maculata TaxID=230809 RepID=A0AAD7HRV0_9AGAR|nr:hypothetical protein DFH07DRAFT_931148 [Mycena maculata]